MAGPFTTIHFPNLQYVGDHVSYSSIATSTPVTLPAGANGWLIQAVGQNVRIKLGSGNQPSSGGGFQLQTGQLPVLLLAPNSGYFFYVIQETATASFEVQPVSQ